MSQETFYGRGKGESGFCPGLTDAVMNATEKYLKLKIDLVHCVRTLQTQGAQEIKKRIKLNRPFHPAAVKLEGRKLH